MGISRCQSQTLHAACHAELFRSKAFREKNLTITIPPGLRRVSAEVGCVRPLPRPALGISSGSNGPTTTGTSKPETTSPTPPGPRS